MSKARIDFGKVISPLTEGEFFADYWQQKPLIHSAGTPDRFAGLLSLDDVDFLISIIKPADVASLKLIMKAKALPAAAYLNGEGGVDLDSVYRAYAAGHTILLTNVEQRWKPVGQLCRQIEAAFLATGVVLRNRVAVNMYLTPTTSQGFPPHYDNHDTLILQLEGTKDWRLYQPIMTFPVEPQLSPLPAAKLPPLEKEFRMKPGDVLYMPRGFYHEAATLAGHSLHLTIGLYPATWIDLIGRLMAADAQTRAALPVGAETTKGDLLRQLKARCESLAAREDVAKVMDALRNEFVDHLKIPADSGFTQLNTYQSLELDHLVAKRDGTVGRLTRENGELRLRFSGGGFAGPEQLEPVFRFIIESDVFCPRDLPGVPSDEIKLKITSDLIREGFLKIVGTRS